MCSCIKHIIYWQSICSVTVIVSILCHPGILVCLGAGAHGVLYLPHCHPVCPSNESHDNAPLLVLFSLLLRQIKQNSLLQAGHIICLQAPVCCTNPPQWGQALNEGVFTPAIVVSSHSSNHWIRGSLPPTTLITANTIDPWCMPTSCRDWVEFSRRSVLPIINRSFSLLFSGWSLFSASW